jgi:hypothetical protein
VYFFILGITFSVFLMLGPTFSVFLMIGRVFFEPGEYFDSFSSPGFPIFIQAHALKNPFIYMILFLKAW